MSVSIATVVSAVVTGVALLKKVSLLSESVDNISGRLSPESKLAFERSVLSTGATELNSISPVSRVRASFQSAPPLASAVSSVEQVKGKVLAHISSLPYLITDAKAIEQGLHALRAAKTLDEVERAKEMIVTQAEEDHHAVFSDALAESYRNASRRIGFTRIEPLPSGKTSLIRFSATDANGRTLVNEIETSINRDPRAATEVVGVTDGSCHSIVDEFCEALKEEGVTVLPPKRRSTGGIAELSAVRDFLARKLSRNEGSLPADTGDIGVPVADRRASRLNRILPKVRQ
jgi:hypothetical protein